MASRKKQKQTTTTYQYLPWPFRWLFFWYNQHGFSRPLQLAHRCKGQESEVPAVSLFDIHYSEIIHKSPNNGDARSSNLSVIC